MFLRLEPSEDQTVPSRDSGPEPLPSLKPILLIPTWTGTEDTDTPSQLSTTLPTSRDPTSSTSSSRLPSVLSTVPSRMSTRSTTSETPRPERDVREPPGVPSTDTLEDQLTHVLRRSQPGRETRPTEVSSAVDPSALPKSTEVVVTLAVVPEVEDPTPQE